MAYLRQFSGYTALLLIILMLQGSGGEQSTNRSGYREASNLKSGSSKSINTKEILENYYAEKLENIGIRLRPGSEFTKENFPTNQAARRCKSIVARVFLKLPAAHRAQLSEITLVYNKTMRRGLGGSNSIVLRCLNVTSGELGAVFIHEMGHLVDAHMLFGTDTQTKTGFFDFDTEVPADDPSLLFYRIDWVSEKEQRADSEECDFASVYGMSDPFEDFAETYTFYVLHGPQFKKLGGTCPAFKAKYNFMKQYVFDGQEFADFDGDLKLEEQSRDYDATVLPFSLDKFLAS